MPLALVPLPLSRPRALLSRLRVCPRHRFLESSSPVQCLCSPPAVLPCRHRAKRRWWRRSSTRHNFALHARLEPPPLPDHTTRLSAPNKPLPNPNPLPMILPARRTTPSITHPLRPSPVHPPGTHPAAWHCTRQSQLRLPLAAMQPETARLKLYHDYTLALLLLRPPLPPP